MENTETKTKFTVTRHNWLRGEGGDDSRLLRPEDGKMCCLGHISLQCGITQDEIMNVLAPAGIIDEAWGLFPEPLRPMKRPYRGINKTWNDNSGLAHVMMGLNDDETITDEDREHRLKQIAASRGIKLEFVD